jgi:hypothetical protein
MRVLRWLGVAMVGLGLALALLFAGARYHDGPLALVPGGPLVAGEWVTEPVADWSFASDAAEIELQLVEPPRSRTVWIVVEGGEAFVPCSLDFPPLKDWYRDAERDGRAILRIAGKLYPVSLQRVHDTALLGSLVTRASEKYGGGPPGSEPSRVWFFRVSSRALSLDQDALIGPR